MSNTCIVLQHASLKSCLPLAPYLSQCLVCDTRPFQQSSEESQFINAIRDQTHRVRANCCGHPTFHEVVMLNPTSCCTDIHKVLTPLQTVMSTSVHMTHCPRGQFLLPSNHYGMALPHLIPFTVRYCTAVSTWMKSLEVTYPI